MMRFADRGGFCRASAATCYVALALVYGASMAAAAPPSRAEIERKHREARKRHEEAKRRIEETRRRLERERSVRQPTLPGHLMGNAEQNKESDGRITASTAADLEYRIEPGTALAYHFLFERQIGERSSYLGGVALFRGVAENRGVCLIARDNIRRASSAELLPTTIPDRTSMLPDKISPGRRGFEPWLDDNLPFQLGRAADWFFPPLPYKGIPGATRCEGTSADRMFADDPAYFEWRVTVAECTRGLAELKDSRSFHTNDSRIELKASGTIHFDTGLGIMVRREVAGTYRRGRGVTPFSLTIVYLDRDRLKKLLASQ